jgi:hypothetical protein
MENLKEVANSILLQVNHNKECGKDDKFTIEEIEDIIKRRVLKINSSSPELIHSMRIIKLPTNKRNKAFVYGPKTGYYCGTTNETDKGYHLHVVSDEMPKRDDWYIVEGQTAGEPLQRAGGPDSDYKTARKVEATTDTDMRHLFGAKTALCAAIPQTLVNDFMNSNGSISTVNVVMEMYQPGIDDSGYGFPAGTPYPRPKWKPNNEIVLK